MCKLYSSHPDRPYQANTVGEGNKGGEKKKKNKMKESEGPKRSAFYLDCDVAARRLRWEVSQVDSENI